jgi:hypothetical protein
MYSLLKFTVHDVREDLKLSVCVCSEARLRRNAVLVDDSEGTKLAVFNIMITENDL